MDNEPTRMYQELAGLFHALKVLVAIILIAIVFFGILFIGSAIVS